MPEQTHRWIARINDGLGVPCQRRAKLAFNPIALAKIGAQFS